MTMPIEWRSIEDTLLSICLQLNRRRLAGRGLERRPAPIAREARRPTRGNPTECLVLDSTLDFINSIQSAVKWGQSMKSCPLSDQT